MYAYQRQELLQALVMADGKDRRRAVENFDAWVNAPLEGWDAADRRVQQAIFAA